MGNTMEENCNDFCYSTLDAHFKGENQWFAVVVWWTLNIPA